MAIVERPQIYEGTRIPSPVPAVLQVPAEIRASDDVMTVNYGPNQPSTHGVGPVEVELPVIVSEPVIVTPLVTAPPESPLIEVTCPPGPKGPGGPAEMVPGQHHVRMNMYIAQSEGGTFKVVKNLGHIDPKECEVLSARS